MVACLTKNRDYFVYARAAAATGMHQTKDDWQGSLKADCDSLVASGMLRDFEGSYYLASYPDQPLLLYKVQNIEQGADAKNGDASRVISQ